MPILVIGTNKHRTSIRTIALQHPRTHKAQSSNLGFTLIEILVVIVIIGVLLGVTLLSPITRSPHSVMQAEASRLQQRFSQIRDRALMDHQHFGFSVVDDDHYLWWRLSANGHEWVQLEEPPFKPHRLPESLRLRLETSETLVSIDTNNDGPSVVFYRDYETTPFQLQILPVDRRQSSVILSTDGLTDIQWERE